MVSPVFQKSFILRRNSILLYTKVNYNTFVTIYFSQLIYIQITIIIQFKVVKILQELVESEPKALNWTHGSVQIKTFKKKMNSTGHKTNESDELQKSELTFVIFNFV